MKSELACDLGDLSLFEVDDARRLAGELFRRGFRLEIANFPRHFVIVRQGSDSAIGYVHYTKSDNAYLAGGLVVSALEFRRFDENTANLVRSEGGLAEWAMRTTCNWLDADAIFAYMGDAKSIRVLTRIGFAFTGNKHLYVFWKKPLPAEEKAKLVERIVSVGPF